MMDREQWIAGYRAALMGSLLSTDPMKHANLSGVDASWRTGYETARDEAHGLRLFREYEPNQFAGQFREGVYAARDLYCSEQARMAWWTYLARNARIVSEPAPEESPL